MDAQTQGFSETNGTLFSNIAHRAIAALRVSFALTLLSIVAAAQSYTVTTIAGGQMPATAAYFGSAIVVPAISGLTVDFAGNLYVASSNQFMAGSNTVFMVDPAGTLTRVAGNGTAGFSGDGGRATSAQLNNPAALAVDASGNLYILDLGNVRVRKVAPNGIISTYAGNGTYPTNPYTYVSGDGGPAIKATLFGANSIAADYRGNLYINTVPSVRKVTPDGVISSVRSGVAPGLFAVDAVGNMYSAGTISLMKYTPTGTITIPVGNQFPATGLALDGAGNAYLALWVTFPGNPPFSKIVKISPTGVVMTVAGGDSVGDSGEGGPAVNATLFQPGRITADAAGNYYFIDGVPRIRKVNTAGILTTVISGIGDGGRAAFGAFQSLGSLTRDAAGNLYLIDKYRVRKIDTQGNISTVAGSGAAAPPIAGKLAAQTPIPAPFATAPDGNGNVFIVTADAIYKVDAHGALATVASKSNFFRTGLAIDKNGSLYATSNDCVVKVNSDGSITPVTVCHTATPYGGYSGDGGPANVAQLGDTLGAIAADSTGNLYIADTSNSRVRMISASGVITTVAGTGKFGYAGDGGLATAAQLGSPRVVACDPAGNLLIVDAYSDGSRVRKVSNGIITTLAGPGSSSAGPVTAASIVPSGVAFDGAGGLYITDNSHGTLLQLTPSTKPALILSVSHSESFTIGQTGTFTIVPTNIASTGAAASAMPSPLRAAATNSAEAATNGWIEVTVQLSTGGTPFSLSGEGWTCSAGTCTRSDSLPAGNSYPPITATVLLNPDAPSQLTLQSSVSGGGAPTTGAQDTVDVDGPQLKVTSTDPGNFFAGQIHAVYSVTVLNAGAKATTGAVTLTETLPPGLTLVSMAGSGWVCEGLACTRSDALAGAGSYPPIAVTVNIDGSAASPQVSSAAVSGGGSLNAGGTDAAFIAPSHGAFFSGEASLSSDGWTSLQFAGGILFGSYNNDSYPWIYHQDLGWEYFFDAHDAGGGAYFYDMASQHTWYTNRASFPYLYDFTLKVWLYYFGDTNKPGHYSANPRTFANMTTGQIVTM